MPILSPALIQVLKIGLQREAVSLWEYGGYLKATDDVTTGGWAQIIAPATFRETWSSGVSIRWKTDFPPGYDLGVALYDGHTAYQYFFIPRPPAEEYKLDEVLFSSSGWDIIDGTEADSW